MPTERAPTTLRHGAKPQRPGMRPGPRGALRATESSGKSPKQKTPVVAVSLDDSTDDGGKNESLDHMEPNNESRDNTGAFDVLVPLPSSPSS